MSRDPITKVRSGAMETIITLQMVTKPKSGPQYSFTFPRQLAQAFGYKKGDRFTVKVHGDKFTLQRQQ